MTTQQAKLAGFTTTKIVIIESLAAVETKSGSLLLEFISSQIELNHRNISLELFNCNGADDFRLLLARLTHDAQKTGQAPILQIECHGEQFDGLVFADNSFITWPDLAEILTDLNRACRFNLLAIFSACYAGHFLGEIAALSPAPCWCMIAPTHTVNPGEIMQVIRQFYMLLLEKADVGKAITSISRIRMDEGRWFGQSAEIWFERIVLGYLENHCTHKKVRIRSREMFRELEREGKYCSIGKLKRTLKEQNRYDLLTRYFNVFFMVEDIPENLQRFAQTRNRIRSRVYILQSTRKYVL